MNPIITRQVLWVFYFLLLFVLFLEIAIHSFVLGTSVNISLCVKQFWVQGIQKQTGVLACPKETYSLVGEAYDVIATVSKNMDSMIGGCI